jgi:hypothetical protein
MVVNTAIRVSTRAKWGMRRLVRGALTLLIGVGVRERVGRDRAGQAFHRLRFSGRMTGCYIGARFEAVAMKTCR